MNKIFKIFDSLDSIEIGSKGNGWVNLANIGKALRRENINIAEYGYTKLQSLFESMPASFELYKDITKKVPVVYVRQIVKSPKRINITVGDNDIKSNGYKTLEEWSYLGDINRFLSKLASMARKEIWTWPYASDRAQRLNILYCFIRYTFCRLQHQKKVAYSMDGELAAFNTGLTDDRYEAIIALFKKNRLGKSEWLFDEFVFVGEGNGKILSNEFKGTIERATYIENMEDMLYNTAYGEPILDLEHILIKNIDRLPIAFINSFAPADFNAIDIRDMSATKRNDYYEQLRISIKNDAKAYRTAIYLFKNAVNLAYKRICWNFMDAVPMFYPKQNRICLLMPLCLTNDNVEDVALVVKKTPTNKYEGATILTKEMAYIDARVVNRPESRWLTITDKESLSII